MALIRFYFHSEPKGVADFARSWSQLVFALKFDGKLKVQEVAKG